VADGGVYTSSAAFTLSATDGASGIETSSPRYVLDGVQPAQTFSTPVS